MKLQVSEETRQALNKMTKEEFEVVKQWLLEGAKLPPSSFPKEISKNTKKLLKRY